jgi:hypothetical protein
MCVAKINDTFGNKYRCLLEDHSVITSTTVGKDGISRKRVKTLCKKHGSTHKKNMRYEVKHMYRDIVFTEELINKTTNDEKYYSASDSPSTTGV